MRHFSRIIAPGLPLSIGDCQSLLSSPPKDEFYTLAQAGEGHLVLFPGQFDIEKGTVALITII